MFQRRLVGYLYSSRRSASSISNDGLLFLENNTPTRTDINSQSDTLGRSTRNLRAHGSAHQDVLKNLCARWESADISNSSHEALLLNQQHKEHRHPANQKNLGPSAVITTQLNNSFETNKSSKKTYYRRELPSSLVSFTSDEGRTLFKEALVSGHAEAYFSLSGNFTHQSEPAFCGLGSLAMVLNALEVDPRRTWKGVWRWYSEDMLECCSPLEHIRKQGIHFDEFVCLAKCNGLQVVAKRADQVSKEEFIDDIKSVTSGKHEQHMVVSFSRKTLGQTGDGHFSPIGAYHVEENKVLILDTARFKYPSYFCSVESLYNALKPIDKVTGLSRGYTLLKRLPHQSLSKINFDRMNWTEFAHVLGFSIPRKLSHTIQSNCNSMEKVVEVILETLPSHNQSIMMHMNRPGLDLAGGKGQQDELALQVRQEASKLMTQIEAHPMYKVVKNVFLNSATIRQQLAQRPLGSILGIDVQGFSDLNSGHHDSLSLNDDENACSIRVHMALTTVFLLAAPERMFCTLPVVLQDKILSMINWKGDWRGSKDYRLLQQEVKHLKDQVNSIMQTYCQCSRN